MQVQRPSVFEELKLVDALVDQRAEPAMLEERLPFTVRVVRSEEDLLKAVGVRHSAYARHMPEFAESLRSPEDDDFRNDTVVMLAESKVDRTVLGSVRIQTNLELPLSLELSVKLPDWLQRRSLAEVRRLAIAQGTTGRLVKMILVKACLKFCDRNDIEWAVLAARPPLNKGYEQLLFRDVLEGETFVPLPRANNVAHHVLAFDVENTRARLSEANHPLLKFFCYTHHPDLDVGESANIRSSIKALQNTPIVHTAYSESAR
jgi:hypothetical protein